MQAAYLFRAGLPRASIPGWVPTCFRLAGVTAGCSRLSDGPQTQLTRLGGTAEAG